MSVVDVLIGTRKFQLACEDGEEEKLKDLASNVNERFEMLAKQMRTNNDSMLLLLSALMAEDELKDTKKKLELGTNDSIKNEESNEEEMAEVINTVSNYVESIIGKIENSSKVA